MMILFPYKFHDQNIMGRHMFRYNTSAHECQIFLAHHSVEPNDYFCDFPANYKSIPYPVDIYRDIP